MGKELLLGLGAVAVGAYLLFTSSSKSSTTSALDAAGSFPQFPKTSGSQFGGTSTPVGSGGTVSNPISAGQNKPEVVPTPSVPAPAFTSNYRSYLSDTYFNLNKGISQAYNAERNKLSASGPAARLVDSILSFNVPNLSGGRATPEGIVAGQFKLDDLFSTAQMLAAATQSKGGESLLRSLGREDAIGANISADVLQRTLYDSLRNIGVR